MDEGLKRRLVGATVLVSLVVIFVPMLLEQRPVLDRGISRSNVPLPPPRPSAARVLPSGETPLTPPDPAPARITPLPPAAGQSPRPAKPKPAEPRVGISAWMIQLGSFANRGNADKLVGRLRDNGFATDIERVEIAGKTLYRVLVGPEIDRKRAEATLRRIEKTFKELRLQAKIRRYP